MLACFSRLRPISRALSPVLVALGLMSITAVAMGQDPVVLAPAATPTPAGSRTILMDGAFGDWEGMPAVAQGTTGAISSARDITGVDEASNRPPYLSYVWAAHDEKWVYLRIGLSHSITLQSFDGSLVLDLDVDGDPLTGRTEMPGNGVAGIPGIDVEFVYSAEQRGRENSGMSVLVSERGMPSLPAAITVLQSSFAPTHSNASFEFRFKRGEIVDGTTVEAFTGSRVRGMLKIVDLDGRVIDRSTPFAFGLTEPALIAVGDTDAAATAIVIGKQYDRTYRIMSWNVERGAIFEKPRPFARIFSAVAPDVICFQELGTDTTPSELRAWLDLHLPHPLGWDVMIRPGTGTGIASKLAAVDVGPKEMPMVYEDSRLRATPVMLGAGNRRILALSVHLKCCGRAGDENDVKRMQQSRALHDLVWQIRRSDEPTGVVIIGDYNLVGSIRPLEIMLSDNDFDGSNLAVLNPVVLNDSTLATWRDPDTRFPPGRLDYCLYSDSTLRVVGQYVLDTAALDSTTLRKRGLLPEDSAMASDHLPIVVDVKW